MKLNLSSVAVTEGGRISGLAPVVLPTRVGLGELMGTGLRCGIDLATQKTNHNDHMIANGSVNFPLSLPWTGANLRCFTAGSWSLSDTGCMTMVPGCAGMVVDDTPAAAGGCGSTRRW